MTQDMHVYGKFTDILTYSKKLLMLLLLTVGVNSVWGQSATLPNGDGYYYIINMEAADNGHAYNKDQADNWYLCPVEGDYDYLHWQGNRGMPFLTTNKEGRLAKYLWRVVRSGDNYHIIHDIDNKYLTANDYPGGDDKNTRRRVHIQEEVTTKALFKLKESGKSNEMSTYNISSPSYGDSNFLNPAGNNKPNYGQNNDKNGLIGFYSDNNGSKWFFEFVKKCVTPEITVDNEGNVTITSVTPEATIYYTDDDTDPATSGTRQEYSSAFPIGAAIKIRAIATKSDFDPSIEKVYRATKCQVPTITLNKENGLTTITPHADDEGAKIYYTTDGTTPTTSSTEYAGPFTLSVDATDIKAIAAFDAGGDDASPVAEPEQTLTQLAPPTFSKSDATVTIIKPTKESDGTTDLIGAEAVSVYYNLSNTDPTTSSTEYSSAITLPIDFNQTVIKARAYKPGYIRSDVASISIDKCATPAVVNNGDGTVTISCATEGATIRYTTSTTETAPNDPDKNSTAVSGAVTLSAGIKILKARAYKEGYAQSNVYSYTLPKFNMPKITNTDGTITITSKDGGTIYYSTSETGTPSTPYTGPFSLGSATVVRAYATHVGYLDSDIRTWIPATLITSASQVNLDDPEGNYIINGSFSGSIGTADNPFKGTIDGQGVVISGLEAPLIAYAEGATIKNVILDNVAISSGTNVGAICNEAKGSTRIYNCGVLATGTGTTVVKDKDGYDKITACSSTISGSGYVGGIVGLLDGSSRVINCFSYANITGGNEVGGIVGHNNVATSAANLKTMVMNCMFYGDIAESCENKAPIYNGTNISNVGDNGVSNFNYFCAAATYVENKAINTYNCALLAETRYLQRFEFFRHLLNSNRALAAWWATGDADNKDEMMKWVLEPSQIGSKTPYPILKPPFDDDNNVIQYPSVVNIDAAHAEPFSTDPAVAKTQRNQGRKLGELTVTIQNGNGDQFNRPEGASIIRSSLTLNITDKDPDHFNFNYGKVQLPYYNDVGTGNYTGYRVVTGWKIVSIDGGTPGSFTTGTDAKANANGQITTAPYNFADRHCTNKDLYSKSGRIFNQGAYWDVPEGVTGITIQPYWAEAVYCADDHLDVVYDQNMKNKKTNDHVGGGKLFDGGKTWNMGNQVVYNAISSAQGSLTIKGGVYDNAVVLVGNVHSYSNPNSVKDIGLSSSDYNRPYTIMSVDLDKDNEPDYSYILRFDGRSECHPVRVDFLNIPGLGMAQKSTGGTGTYNFGILVPKGWFESTNTSLFRFTQFEYEHSSRTENDPLILQGGVMEQWVSFNQKGITHKTPYFHVGGNVWFKEFHRGTHQDRQKETSHPPVSVTGGDFDEFYLTGLYRADFANYDDNLECYINGGRFGIVAGAAQEGAGKASDHTNGNVVWQIQNADINEFYGGGLNAVHPVEGNITTVIEGGYIKQFCGGPKFGDMSPGKTVKTTATNCKFDTFFGAGYGGNSYSRFTPNNINNIDGDYGESSWNTFLTNNYKQEYKSTYGGVSVTYFTQYLPMSSNKENVARLLIDFVSFSLATTRNVTSKLTGCTITDNFYGGGSLGKVEGPVSSTLTNCTVKGNVFGAGYSASLPTVDVINTGNFVKAPYYDDDLGVYFDPTLPGTVEYTWQQSNTTVNSTATAIDKTKHYLYTNIDISKTNLGSVNGAVTLTIDGNSEIGTLEGEPGSQTLKANTGNVYGGGDESAVNNTTTPTAAKTTVTIKGNTIVHGDVYGGGNQGVVSGSTRVNIKE